MLQQLRTLLILIPALLLAACATGPQYAQVKSSIPPLAAGQGRIYFYRPGSMLGAAVQPGITLNGEVVGQSQPAGFFYVDRPAGSYDAACSTEVTRKVTFVLEPGQERYIKTSVSMGAMVGHVIPELVDPAVGAKDIVTLHYTPKKTEEKQPNAR